MPARDEDELVKSRAVRGQRPGISGAEECKIALVRVCGQQHASWSPARTINHPETTTCHLLCLLLTLANVSRSLGQNLRQADESVALNSVTQLNHLNQQQQQQQTAYLAQLGPILDPPPVVRQPVVQGPGVDLFALNTRRFELDHHHQGSAAAADNDSKLGELIESNLANVPDRILANLPDDVSREVLDSLATDPALLVSLPGDPNTRVLLEDGNDDPDGASIERLTKSCMTVHASSARPEQLNVTFHLYTKNNPNVPFIMKPHITRLELIKSSPFDVSRPIKWITHGFHTNVDKSEWMVEAKDKILAFEDANVILTDWRRGASPALAFYPKAAANAHVVAKMIVKILRRLKNDVDFSQVHLIGHSLGAHIMGFVGSAFTEEHLHQQQQLLSAQNGNKPYWRDTATSRQASGNHLIGRITACDPALPCFGPTSSAPNSPHPMAQAPITSEKSHQLAENPVSAVWSEASEWTPSMWTHLRPDSAIVVEVMHSNPGVMGYADPLGDYDFYPNGFERQPGCGVINQPGGEILAPASVGGRALEVDSARGFSRKRRQLMNGFLGSIISSVTAPRPGASAPPSEAFRFSHTIDRFIKPIRDFFHGYTCSHHRSVEYMVESLYYERVPQDRKLDRDLVCQMVGYRCSDYLSFKKGFCFKCANELDCRAFTMSTKMAPTTNLGYQPSLIANFQASSARALSSPDMLIKFRLPNQTLNSSVGKNQQFEPNFTHPNASQRLLEISQRLAKRVLPTNNHYNQNYLPQKKNQYFFDTKPSKEFCLHHYHLYVKYRWFRVRDGISIDGLELMGTLANITKRSQISLNKYTYQSYTMLLTEPVFLGQIESLILFGQKIKPMYIEHIEVTYLSNLDFRVRALGSARLCRSREVNIGGAQIASLTGLPLGAAELATASLFARCSGQMV